MATTIVYTAKSVSQYFSVAEINTLFSAIKAVLDQKLDRRASTVGSSIVGTGVTIINVPAPTTAGDIRRV